MAPKPEVGAYGAVVAGLAALGRSADMLGATDPEVVVQPRPAVAGVYAQMYERYRMVVQKSRLSWKERLA